MFPQISFRRWHERRADDAEYDLLSTSLNRPGARSGDVVPAPLRDLSGPVDDADVRELVAREYDVPEANVAVTARCQHANFLVAAAVHDLATRATGVPSQGSDRVLVETPAYEPLGKTPGGFDLTVDRFERRPQSGYALNPASIERAITDDTALVIVTNRHNPSGRLTDLETLDELGGIAAAHDALLQVDEVFSPFVRQTPDVPRTAFGGGTAALRTNTVVTSSLTKFHGLYDVNVGWVIAEESVVDRVRSIEDHTNVTARPNRQLAARALANSEEFRRESREILRQKNDLLSAFATDRDDLSGAIAEDHVFAFFNHADTDGDAVADAAFDEGVLVYPGRFFGDSNRFRVSLGYDLAQCRDGLAALGEALSGL